MDEVLKKYVTKDELNIQLHVLTALYTSSDMSLDYQSNGKCRLVRHDLQEKEQFAYMTPHLSKREMWCFITGAIMAHKKYV